MKAFSTPEVGIARRLENWKAQELEAEIARMQAELDALKLVLSGNNPATE